MARGAIPNSDRNSRTQARQDQRQLQHSRPDTGAGLMLLDQVERSHQRRKHRATRRRPSVIHPLQDRVNSPPHCAKEFTFPILRVFISYRRNDTFAHVRNVYDRLAAHFGKAEVFIDIDTLRPGVDFVDVLEKAVVSCACCIPNLHARCPKLPPRPRCSFSSTSCSQTSASCSNSLTYVSYPIHLSCASRGASDSGMALPLRSAKRRSASTAARCFSCQASSSASF